MQVITKYFPFLIIFAGVIATGYILWYFQSNPTIFAQMTANDQKNTQALKRIEAQLQETQ